MTRTADRRVRERRAAAAAAAVGVGLAVLASRPPAPPSGGSPPAAAPDAATLPDPGPGWDRWTADEFRTYLGDHGAGVEVAREDTADDAQCVAAARPGVVAWGPFLLAGPPDAVAAAAAALPGRRPGAGP